MVWEDGCNVTTGLLARLALPSLFVAFFAFGATSFVFVISTHFALSLAHLFKEETQMFDFAVFLPSVLECDPARKSLALDQFFLTQYVPQGPQEQVKEKGYAYGEDEGKDNGNDLHFLVLVAVAVDAVIKR